MTRRRMTIAAVLAALALSIVALRTRGDAAAAGPFVPRDDRQVLEHLATGRLDPRARELAAMRRRLDAQPNDLPLATAVARRNIEESRARSDPRYLGYAQAALAPWWTIEAAPPEVLVLRGTIRQSAHDFDGALRDLDQVVRATPDDPQAWITRSVVLTVRGDYDAARESCAPLARLTSARVVTVCYAAIDGVTGEAARGYARLSRALATGRARSGDSSDAADEGWAISTLGELAVRLGDTPAAERHFEQALAIDPSDAYTLAAWSDLLLDLGRAREVAARLEGREANDGLLLRLAMAEDAAALPRAKEHAELLRARFAASHARGDTVHRREEARFVLGIERDARGALALATANWEVQKEPWDARVLLEAALAARDAAAAARIAEWLGRTRLEDPAIAKALASMGEGR